MTQPKLYIHLKDKTLVCNITKLPIQIGSSEEASISIKDPSLGKFHCEITQTPGGYKLKDLQSPTGTFVNGKRIKETFLKDGDEIKIGKIILRFERKLPPSKAPPKPKKRNPLIYLAVLSCMVLGVLGYFILRPREKPPSEEEATILFQEAEDLLRLSKILIRDPKKYLQGYRNRLEAYEKLKRLAREFPLTKTGTLAKDIILKEGLQEWARRENQAKEEVPKFLETLEKPPEGEIPRLLTLCTNLLHKYSDTSMERKLLQAKKRLELLLEQIRKPTLEDLYALEIEVNQLLEGYKFAEALKKAEDFLKRIRKTELEKKALELKNSIILSIEKDYQQNLKVIEELLKLEKSQEALRRLQILKGRYKKTPFEERILEKIKAIKEGKP